MKKGFQLHIWQKEKQSDESLCLELPRRCVGEQDEERGILYLSLKLHKEKRINNVLVYLCLETECILYPLGEKKPVTWASD